MLINNKMCYSTKTNNFSPTKQGLKDDKLELAFASALLHFLSFVSFSCFVLPCHGLDFLWSFSSVVGLQYALVQDTLFFLKKSIWFAKSSLFLHHQRATESLNSRRLWMMWREAGGSPLLQNAADSSTPQPKGQNGRRQASKLAFLYINCVPLDELLMWPRQRKNFRPLDCHPSL